MAAKPTIRPDTRSPLEPTIPEPPNDGFPPDQDVSTPAEFLYEEKN